MTRNTITVLMAALLAASARPAAAQPIAIAAASDLQAALPVITAQFEQQMRTPARVTFGSSGNFFSQIQNGAPFDVFLSADVEYPLKLIAAGSAVKDSLYEYAIGRLVVWTRADRGVDVKNGLGALTLPAVRHIAIANPDHAPYGRAAVAALQHEGIYEAVKGKLVLGENISQAAQFVQSGNADAGILALSVALAPALKSSGRYVEVPGNFHPPIRQAAVVLTRSPRQGLARQFLEFLKRPEIVKLLTGFGFTPPVGR